MTEQHDSTTTSESLFPVITHIDQFRRVLNHFRAVFKQQKKPFPYVEKCLLPHKRYSIFNYTFMTVDTFPEIIPQVTTAEEAELIKIVREMRGVCFDLVTGVCVSRGLQKFFNVDERESTKREKIDLNKGHVVLEKADGTMVCAMFAYLDDEEPTKGLKHIRFRSEMGWDTDVSKDHVEPFIYGSKMGQKQCYPVYYQSDLHRVDTIQVHSEGSLDDAIDCSRSNYLQFCFKWLKRNYSPIFEFVGPSNCIVLAYSEPKLILLALRHNVDGHYIPYEEMRMDAQQHGVAVAEAYRVEPLEVDTEQKSDVSDGDDGNAVNEEKLQSRMDKLMTRIKSMEGLEGFVLRFDDGTMHKIKSNWYHELHRTKCSQRAKVGMNRTECDIWRAILSNELDDIIAEVKFQETKDDLNHLNDRVIKCVAAVTEHFVRVVDESRVQYPDRKDYFRVFLPQYQSVVVTKRATDGIEKSLIKALYELREECAVKDCEEEQADTSFVLREEEMKAVIDVIKQKLTGKNIPVGVRTLLEKIGGEKLMYAETAYLNQQQKMQRKTHGIEVAN